MIGRFLVLLRDGLFLLLFLSLIQIRVYGQDISISASVDNNRVTIDDLIAYRINVSGNVRSIPEPKLPQLSDFQVYSSDRSQSISIINGQMSAATNFSYVLSPKKEGKFVIGEASVTFGQKTYKTQPITVEILPSGQGKAQIPSKVSPREDGKGENIFIATSVDKRRVYFNEQITLSFKFYQRVRLFEEPEYTPPEKIDFWSEDLPPQQRYYENVNGYQYMVTEIKTALFPTVTGKLTIGPAGLKYLEGDPFNFFSNPRQKVLKTEPIEVDVLPLHGNKPSSFKGAVGNFTIDTRIDTTLPKVGEPITCQIKIKGEGNIKAIGEPDLNTGENFRVYPSASSDNIKKQDYKVQGEKNYEYYLIPKKAGNRIIPGVQFSYFDPKKEKYITAKTMDVSITIKPGAVEKAGESGSSPSLKEDVKLIAKDIRPIKFGTDLTKEKRLLIKNPLFILLICFPVLFLILSKIYVRHQEQLESNPLYRRNRQANKLIRKRLKEAVAAYDKTDYCSLISRAVLGFIGDKLNISETGLTSELLKDILIERNVPSDIQQRLAVFLEKCDYIRFSHVESKTGWRDELLNEAKEIIKFLERHKWQ